MDVLQAAMRCSRMHASGTLARAMKLALLVCVACTQRGQWNDGIGKAHQQRNRTRSLFARFGVIHSRPADGPTYPACHGADASNLILWKCKEVYRWELKFIINDTCMLIIC